MSIKKRITNLEQSLQAWGGDDNNFPILITVSNTDNMVTSPRIAVTFGGDITVPCKDNENLDQLHSRLKAAHPSVRVWLLQSSTT